MKHVLITMAFLLRASASAQYDDSNAPGAGHPQLIRGTQGSSGEYSTRHGQRGNDPMNDNCADALQLTVHPYGSCPGLSTAGDNTDATYNTDEPTCDITASQVQDVWYTFTTGPEYSVIITLTPGTGMSDWALGLYDFCGGTSLYCHGLPIGPVVHPIQPFTTYWLSVWSNNDFGTAGPFELCVEAAPAPPANDLCSSVVPQEMAVGDTWAFTGDATGGTNTEEIAYNTVWHAVTLTEPADLKVDFCGSEAYDLWGNFYRTIYLTCPPNFVDRVWAGSYDTTACSDGRLTICYAKLAEGTYYLPVAPPAEAGDGYIMNVRTDAFGSNVPPNDECAGALPLNVGALCNPVNYLPQCATQSLPAIDCGVPDATANDDVWYSFTAPDNLVTLAVFAHTYDYSPVIDVYSGTCGALVEYDCVDAAAQDSVAQLTLFSPDPGATYYFRVYNGYGTTPLSNASYELCVVEGEEVVIGLDEAMNYDMAGLYPNPNDGNFTVPVDPRATTADLQVIDATGRTVLYEHLTASNGVVAVQAGGLLSTGLYVTRTNDGFRIRQARLIIR